MEPQHTRRQILQHATGAVLGAVLLTRQSGAADAAPTDTCFWRREQAVCDNGEAWEYWCYYCCVGQSCEVLECEWRVVGTC